MDKLVSIFNDFIGPVMTGPSSSQTVGPTRIGKLSGKLFHSQMVNFFRCHEW